MVWVVRDLKDHLLPRGKTTKLNHYATTKNVMITSSLEPSIPLPIKQRKHKINITGNSFSAHNYGVACRISKIIRDWFITSHHPPYQERKANNHIHIWHSCCLSHLPCFNTFISLTNLCFQMPSLFEKYHNSFLKHQWKLSVENKKPLQHISSVFSKICFRYPELKGDRKNSCPILDWSREETAAL